MRSDSDGRSTQPAHCSHSAGRRRAGRRRQRRGRHPRLHRARWGLDQPRASECHEYSSLADTAAPAAEIR
eukprot:7133402-Pyramimonas_sp.AAC.1